MTTFQAQLQILPEQILEFDTLPSTNDYLKDAITSGALAQGTVIWARNQTHGKGLHSNIWFTEPGKNITLSLLLQPKNLMAHEAFRLSKVIALAVLNTVSHFVKGNISIKWPNDIFVDSQKIAGVLIENTIQGDMVKNSIIGIGINVNQTVFLSENNPVSFQKITGKTYDLKEIITVLLEKISNEYLQLQLNNHKKIDGDYFQRLHRVYSEQTFIIHNKEKKCFIVDVLPDGRIILNVEGNKEVYLHGEVKWKL